MFDENEILSTRLLAKELYAKSLEMELSNTKSRLDVKLNELENVENQLDKLEDQANRVQQLQTELDASNKHNQMILDRHEFSDKLMLRACQLLPVEEIIPDQATRQEFLTHCQQNNKLNAVKILRSQTNLGLKETKDICELRFFLPPECPAKTG